MKGDVKASKTNPVLNYFRDSYLELRKVTWPTRNQAVRLTFLVLGFCLVAAAIVGALDLAFNFGYRKLVDIAPPAAISTDVSPSTTAAPSQSIAVTPGDVVATPVTEGATPASDPGVTVTPVSGGTVKIDGTQQ